MRTDDELDEWLERLPAGTPLARLAEARFEALPVDERQVERITDRALARLGIARRPWPRIALSAGIAALAASLGFVLWPRGPDRPAVDWVVRAAPLGSITAEVEAADDPERLAALLAEGRPEDAIRLYRWLLAGDPAGPRAAAWQRALVDAAMAAGDVELAWTEVLALRDRYGAGTAWAEHWGAGSQPLVTAALRDQARYWHGRSVKSQDPVALERAGLAYELYLADVPAGPEDAEVRYGYGELLHATGRLDEAWEQYLAVADRHPDSPRAQFCAESALHAAEQLASADPGSGDQLGVWEERLLESVDAFADLWVDDPRAPQWQYRAAFLLYERGQIERSREYFDRVIAAAPGTSEASFAAELVLDGLAAEGRRDQIEVRARSWLGAGWPEGELRVRLEEVLADGARQPDR